MKITRITALLLMVSLGALVVVLVGCSRQSTEEASRGVEVPPTEPGSAQQQSDSGAQDYSVAPGYSAVAPGSEPQLGNKVKDMLAQFAIERRYAFTNADERYKALASKTHDEKALQSVALVLRELHFLHRVACGQLVVLTPRSTIEVMGSARIREMEDCLFNYGLVVPAAGWQSGAWLSAEEANRDDWFSMRSMPVKSGRWLGGFTDGSRILLPGVKCFADYPIAPTQDAGAIDLSTPSERAKKSVDSGMQLATGGDPVKALASFHDALAIYERIGDSDLQQALCHEVIGGELANLGDPGGAVGEKQKALALYAKYSGTETLQARCNKMIGVYSNINVMLLELRAINEGNRHLDVGHAFLESGRLIPALQAFQTAVAWSDKLPAKPDYLTGKAAMHEMLAEVFSRLGRESEARKESEEASRLKAVVPK